jgi:hypothetical protein
MHASLCPSQVEGDIQCDIVTSTTETRRTQGFHLRVFLYALRVSVVPMEFKGICNRVHAGGIYIHHVVR